jgi:CheY-like chemotaxis protein
MDSVVKVTQAIASLSWPLIVIWLLYHYRPAIAAIVESARSRKFTLKVGGQELTMEEANSTQQSLIADLQNQVSQIQKHLGASMSITTSGIDASGDKIAPKVSAVLWVDDNPKNNSYFVQQLTNAGIRVDLGLSTEDGVAAFKAKRYDYVISDMGREEGKSFNDTAGLDLLKELREIDPAIPIVFFSSLRAVREYGSKAKLLGANAITSSATELFGILNLASAHR